MDVGIGIDDKVCWDGVCDAGLGGRKKRKEEEGMGGGGSDKGGRSRRYQGEVSDECCYGGSCVIVSLCLVCSVAETSAFLPLNAYIFLTLPNTVIAPSPSNSFLCTNPQTPAQTIIPSSNPPATPGAPPSKSTASTIPLPSCALWTRLPKYFLATSLSCFPFHISSLLVPRSSTLFCRPLRKFSAGNLRILRTSEEMRRLLVWV